MVFGLKFFCVLLPSNSDGSGVSSTVKTVNIYPDLTLIDIFRSSINLKYGLSAQAEKII